MKMHNLHSTDDLINAYAADGEFTREELDATIGVAIDAIYTARDAGLVMHGAGAAAAVAVLRALREWGDYAEEQRQVAMLRSAQTTAESVADLKREDAEHDLRQGNSDVVPE